MNPESIFFDNVKEDRGWYFVEYSPPIPDYQFATVQLVFLKEPAIVDVVKAMEEELAVWTRRYPIPVMISAFDCAGTVCDLSAVKPCNHLMGYLDDGANEPRSFWRLLDSHEMPTNALDRDRLQQVYAAIPHRTGADLRAAALNRARQIRLGRRIAWTFVFMWMVVIPVTIAVIGLTSMLVGIVTTVYSILHGAFQALKLCGVWKLSARQRGRERENALVRHHHHHCALNPQGFQRLKLENFEREERERIQQDGKLLRNKGQGPDARTT